MDPLTFLVLVAVALLPARFAFSEASLAAAIRNLASGDREDVRPFAQVTEAVLHDALIAAADGGIVREVEVEPGRFLIVRTDRRVELARGDLPAAIAARFDRGALDIPQPEGDALDRALQVPVATVALRRAILSPTQFVWPAEDYAALLDAARRLPRNER
jgi:hypothetical protein